MVDVGENVAAMHVAVGHVVGVDHAGQLFARRRARTAATHDQSMLPSRGVGGLVPAVRRRRRTWRSNRTESQKSEHDSRRAISIATTPSAGPVGEERVREQQVSAENHPTSAAWAP